MLCSAKTALQYQCCCQAGTLYMRCRSRLSSAIRLCERKQPACIWLPFDVLHMAQVALLLKLCSWGFVTFGQGQ